MDQDATALVNSFGVKEQRLLSDGNEAKNEVQRSMSDASSHTIEVRSEYDADKEEQNLPGDDMSPSYQESGFDIEQ